MDWPTYLALKNLFPNRRKCTFFTAMSIIGVMLGVAVLVIVQSVMNGFQAEIKEDIVCAQGEIRIEGKNIIENSDQIAEKICTLPEVEAIAPYVHGAIMIMHNDIPVFPIAKGVDIEKESNVSKISKILQFCSLEDLGDDDIIMGETLAERLGIEIGDFVEIYTPLALEALQKDTVIFPRDVRVAGYFSTGHHNLNAILCPLSLMQDLYETAHGIHGFTVKLKEGQPVEQVAERLQEILGDAYRVTDWIHGNGELLFALRWEKTMMFFVLLFILLVASFSISSTLITNVVRKTREIGLIMAIGGSRYGIAKCFCLQGFFIGISGTFLGIAGGMTVLHYRDFILKGISFILSTGGAQHYLSQFVHLPVAYHGSDFILITLFSLLICLSSGIIPGIRASRTHPAEALRYEQ